MIKVLCRACGELPLKPSKRHSPWRRPQHLIAASASSTFWLLARKSSLCQNGLLEGRRGACLSAFSEWLLGRMEGLGNGAPTWCLPSPPAVLLTSTLWPLYYHPATQEASFSYLQCWQCRDLQQLAHFEGWTRTDATAVGSLSLRWGLGEGETVLAASSPHSILTPKLTKTAIGARSAYSRLGGSFFPQHFAGAIKTRHQ